MNSYGQWTTLDYSSYEPTRATPLPEGAIAEPLSPPQAHFVEMSGMGGWDREMLGRRSPDLVGKAA